MLHFLSFSHLLEGTFCTVNSCLKSLIYELRNWGSPCFSRALGLFPLQFLLEISCNLQKKWICGWFKTERIVFHDSKFMKERINGDLNWNLIWVIDKYVQAETELRKPSQANPIILPSICLVHRWGYVRQISNWSSQKEQGKLLLLFGEELMFTN